MGKQEDIISRKVTDGELDQHKDGEEKVKRACRKTDRRKIVKL